MSGSEYRVKLPSVTQNARYLITAYGKSTSNPLAKIGVRFVFLNGNEHQANFYLDNFTIERLYSGAPQNLSAIRNDEGIVTLSWDEAQMPSITVGQVPVGNYNTAFVASYNIYASTTPGLTRDSEKIASVNHIEGQENYSLTLEGDFFSTTFAGKHYFIVTAVDTDGWEGVVSNEVNVELLSK